jgi:3-hydroxybutyryl-CoA dehydrogenase
MGRQIALNTALHGVPVALYDIDPGMLDDATQWAATYLEDRVQRGRVDRAAATAALARLQSTANLGEAAGDADLVIEAATESLEIKRRIFADLDRIVRPATILATNSSTIVSSKLADVTTRPERVANLHYFNPALVMQVVEVVQGPHTDDATAQALLEFARRTGKTPIHLRKEIFGFVANRLLNALTREAIFLVEGDFATAEEVDLASEKALGHPMGPFRLMDLIGLDVLDLMWRQEYAETGRAADQPPASLSERVRRGDLGRKTGRGWYDYPEAEG